MNPLMGAVAHGHARMPGHVDPPAGAGAGDRVAGEVHHDAVGPDDQAAARAVQVGVERDVGGHDVAAGHRRRACPGGHGERGRRQGRAQRRRHHSPYRHEVSRPRS
ncbi:hypothetical protein ACBI99_42535 [Nonomuraea sp. ATR24]|uniref:hypothetical protein n=1 Tax=Nonomuraea sp. ATR24 TaxID=1676744 RepID=UPI0035BF74F7